MKVFSLSTFLSELPERYSMSAALSLDVQISGISTDSRAIKPGDLFVAIRGAKSDGHQFVLAAITAGAAAVIVDEHAVKDAKLAFDELPLIRVADSRRALAFLAARFYSNPSSKMYCLGITGTNGKTSIAWLAAHLFAKLSGGAAMVGTLGRGVVRAEGMKEIATLENTTPDPIVIQRFLEEALQEGVTAAALEATSQGFAHYRTRYLQWDGAVFSNLSRDHLDLHGTIDEYRELKFKLFSEELSQSEKSEKSAVLWLDDPTGRMFYERLTGCTEFQVIGVGEIAEDAELRVSQVTCSLSGTRFLLSNGSEQVEIRTQLLGRYNVCNAALAVAAVAARGYSLSDVAEVLADVPAVAGRLEPVVGGEAHIFIDYAHTPDALVNVQRSLRELGEGRLITVFGCGGDRDRGKRPMMAAAVEQWSDVAVVTSDNPRTEDPERIIDDIIPGFTESSGCKVVRQADRRKAIAEAIGLAAPGDMILIAGKGHEDYQEVHGVKQPFLDSEVCRELLSS